MGGQLDSSSVGTTESSTAGMWAVHLVCWLVAHWAARLVAHLVVRLVVQLVAHWAVQLEVRLVAPRAGWLAESLAELSVVKLAGCSVAPLVVLLVALLVALMAEMMVDWTAMTKIALLGQTLVVGLAKKKVVRSAAMTATEIEERDSEIDTWGELLVTYSGHCHTDHQLFSTRTFDSPSTIFR